MKTSDELHRARKAFETERATHPDAAARERAIGLAMQAFDRKNQTIGQEMRSGERLNQRNDNALWRRIMSHFATNRKTLMAGVASAALVAIAMVSTYRMSPQHAGPDPTGGYESPALPGSDTRLTEEEMKSADLIAPQPAPAAEPALAYLTRERSNPETAKADQMRQPMGMAGQQYDLALDRREDPGSVPLDPTAPGWQEQGRDNFQDVESNPVKLVAEDPVSTFSVDVDTASYAFMRSSLNNDVLPPKRLGADRGVHQLFRLRLCRAGRSLDPVQCRHFGVSVAMEHECEADADRHQGLRVAGLECAACQSGVPDRHLGLDGCAGQAAVAEKRLQAAFIISEAGRHRCHCRLCRWRGHGAGADAGRDKASILSRPGPAAIRRVDRGRRRYPPGLSIG